MTVEQITGVLRILVPAMLSFGVARGWFTSEQMSQLVNAIIEFVVAAIVLASLIWSFKSNSKTGQIARVAKMPEVRKIIAEPQIADVALRDERKVVSK